jgi:hypothetical protein
VAHFSEKSPDWFWIILDVTHCYPLVIFHSLLWTITEFFIGKSSNSMGHGMALRPGSFSDAGAGAEILRAVSGQNVLCLALSEKSSTHVYP